MYFFTEMRDQKVFKCYTFHRITVNTFEKGFNRVQNN